MKHTFTREQVEFLQNYYPQNGSDFCAASLKMPAKQIRKKAGKLKLKLTPQAKSLIQKGNAHKRGPKSLNAYKVDATAFFNATKETAYILGMLWADGYLLKNGYRISIELVLEDLSIIRHLFENTGAWRFYQRKRKNRQTQGTLLTTNKPLYEFLAKLDYDKKSYTTADKIINYLPESLRPYWFRGYFDGDGCFYYNKKNFCKQCTITGSYQQDWSFMENLFKELNIRYKTIKTKINKGNHSRIRISNKDGISKFGEYIYGSQYDDLGFKRKYDKYLQILS